VSISEKLFIRGDLNEHVGSTRVGFDGVHASFMYGSRNQEGEGILTRREDRHACLDCKVIPRECVVPQHKLVVADFRFWIRFQRSKRIQVPQTKWWKLKEEAAKTFKERVLNEGP
jgi:hypothetical protein